MIDDVNLTAVDEANLRLANAGASYAQRDVLFDERTQSAAAQMSSQIENFIGSVSVPLGIVGPLTIHRRSKAQAAWTDWLCRIPLATSEGALVASYGRGIKAMQEAGGCSVCIVDRGITRTPVFTLQSMGEAVAFADWVSAHLTGLQAEVLTTTRHGKLLDVTPSIEGNRAYVAFRFDTGEAAGQNMATIATAAACRAIRRNAPFGIAEFRIDGNFSSDKKASVQSLLSTRGRRVLAEVVLPGHMVAMRLHTTAEAMVEFCQMSAIGSAMSGQIGSQAHYANGLAAFYLATGQDVACVAESAIGITRFSLSGNDLRASVMLPAIIVGSVGGGTALPTQRAARDFMGLPLEDPADALAEAAAALCLAGELSIAAAMCSDQFADAHQRLGRRGVALAGHIPVSK